MQTTTLTLSEEQLAAIAYTLSHVDKGIVAIDGPAGSGKTTLMKELTKRLKANDDDYIVTATTTKAAQVLRRKGNTGARTIHAACLSPVFLPPLSEIQEFLDSQDKETYKAPETLTAQYTLESLKAAALAMNTHGINAAMQSLGITNPFKWLSHWDTKPMNEKVTVIVDEASMLSEDLLDKLQDSYKRIILIGDCNQLSPVDSKPVFWSVKKRVLLTEVHRQAANSQPLQIAHALLRGELPDMKPITPIDLDLSRAGSPVICWRNKTRTALIHKIRKAIGHKSDMPEVGEILTCRNSQDRKLTGLGLANNTMWQVAGIDDQHEYTLTNDNDDTVDSVHMYIEETRCGRGTPFRFGYAMTAHTAQGSEWPEVMINVEDAQAFLRAYPDEARKWLYTAVTRAQDYVRWV